jgi:hypothetical protein
MLRAAKTARWNKNTFRVSSSGAMHSRGVVTVYFHNAASFMTIMRGSANQWALALTSCNGASEKPSVAPPREIFCRISGRTLGETANPPTRERSS